MPEPGIILDPDQAEELRELITLTGIVQEWLHYAGDIILDSLADFAYHDTFRPRSYAAWLIQDLACLSGRLRKAAAPPAASHNSQHHDQAPAPPPQDHRRQPSQDQQIPPATPLTRQLP
jgi:hypothetical protein